MELTGFGPSYRLKTHNASPNPAPPTHTANQRYQWPRQAGETHYHCQSCCFDEWRDILSSVIGIRTQDWWRPCDCFRAALSRRTAAIWKPAFQFKRVKQDIHICDNYLFKCLGQWIVRRKKKNHVQTFITHHWHHILKNLLLPFGSALMAKDSFVCVYPGTPHQLHTKKKRMPLLGRVLDWIIDLWILEFNPHNFLHHHNPHPPSPLPLVKIFFFQTNVTSVTARWSAFPLTVVAAVCD